MRGVSSSQSPAAQGMHTGRTSRLYSDQATRCDFAASQTGDRTLALQLSISALLTTEVTRQAPHVKGYQGAERMPLGVKGAAAHQ